MVLSGKCGIKNFFFSAIPTKVDTVKNKLFLRYCLIYTGFMYIVVEESVCLFAYQRTHVQRAAKEVLLLVKSGFARRATLVAECECDTDKNNVLMTFTLFIPQEATNLAWCDANKSSYVRYECAGAQYGTPLNLTLKR